MDGNGEVEYTIPRHALIYYPKNMLPSILLQIFVQLASAAVFTAIESEWTLFRAFYHCLVTATTVGFGDMTIATQNGRLWASFHMILSVCMLGELIGTLDTLREERTAQLARAKQLQR